MDKIYEMVDVTDEERYFTIGLFTTRQVAINHIEESGVAIFDELNADSCKVEVRERDVNKLNWSATGKMVFERTWVRNWDAGDEDKEWSVHSKPIPSEESR